MQDQMDVTSGIVVQAKLQKLMFKQRDQTLAMGCTHGTNNEDWWSLPLQAADFQGWASCAKTNKLPQLQQFFNFQSLELDCGTTALSGY
ncbi:Serine protease family S01A [Phytophthora palmivora]|uniref:Serine protease family S01A n=1 Tax=Phytophthora palmivora TaxID=4796 RepID=A0A2P4Y0V8_9STRA|nr:Serine protease family S01A [Phytophthora palmivora]